MRPEARTSSQLGRRTSADVPWLECDEVVQECGGVWGAEGGRDCALKPFFRAVCSVPLSGKTEGSGQGAQLYCMTREVLLKPVFGKEETKNWLILNSMT